MLARVAQDCRIDNDEDHRDLLFRRCLLEYRYFDDNDELQGWYDVHPLMKSLPEFQIRAEGDYTQYLAWTPHQRQRRILEIQSLLEAPALSSGEKAALYFEQGNLFMASTKWEAALAAYDAAIALHPDDPAALNNKRP